MLVPSGYERLLLGHAVAVARSDVAASVRRALVSADGSRSTLHEFAARHPSARALQGRGTAFAVPLPGSQNVRVVVRHNRHGGLFAALTGDRFLSPTHAPHELEVAMTLASLGIPTPQVLAYALYPPGGIVQRADVCSLEIPGGMDLADILVRGHDAARTGALDATATLVAALSHAGARHHDLNAKNILITTEAAYVLDVDRVTLGGRPDAALNGNLTRLSRSLRKWRDRFGARITEQEITQLGDFARNVRPRPASAKSDVADLNAYR